MNTATQRVADALSKLFGLPLQDVTAITVDASMDYIPTVQVTRYIGLRPLEQETITRRFELIPIDTEEDEAPQPEPQPFDLDAMVANAHAKVLRAVENAADNAKRNTRIDFECARLKADARHAGYVDQLVNSWLAWKVFP